MRLPQNKFNSLHGLMLCALCLVSWFDFGAVALAQTQCETELKDAEQKYFAGSFDEAIELADGCLQQSGLSAATQLRAYRLMALAYQAKDYASKAREAIRSLLKLVPEYKPDPVQDPPPYIELVDQVREEEKKLRPAPSTQQPEQITPPKKKSSKKWFFIGGGVVGVAAIAALTLGGGGGDNGGNGVIPPLPLPPDLP